MAVPKKRTSKSKKNKRKFVWKNKSKVKSMNQNETPIEDVFQSLNWLNKPHVSFGSGNAKKTYSLD